MGLDFKYWDRHKIASVFTMIMIILSFGFGLVVPDLENVAWERASEGLSDDDIQSIIKYQEAYERQLSPRYHALDSAWTWVVWIGMLTAIYSGFTALYIPERYHKEPKEKPTKENTLISQ